jgi:hypothetical protein
LDKWHQEIKNAFEHTATEIQDCLEFQNSRFEKNIDFVSEKIKENYDTERYPTKAAVLEKLNSFNTEGADKYLRELNNLINSSESKSTLSMFEVLQNALLNQIENNPEFTIPVSTQTKLNNLVKTVKDGLLDVQRDLVKSVKKKKISNLTKLNAHSTKRELSNDKLSAFLEFTDDVKFNLRLNKRINTDISSAINCNLFPLPILKIN